MKTESQENLVPSDSKSSSTSTMNAFDEKYDALNDNDTAVLSPVEKKFLLLAERGDCAGVRNLMQEYKDRPEELNINCVDPLNRSSLIAAIENENIELIRLMLDSGILVKVRERVRDLLFSWFYVFVCVIIESTSEKDALLHAIDEEYVEAVETLLYWEEEHHEPGQPYVSYTPEQGISISNQ